MARSSDPAGSSEAGAVASREAVLCHDLVVSYGPFEAVSGLSITASHGEVVALVGPNGAGKTSTIEALEGYRRPTRGTVSILGLDPVRDHRHLVAKIGVMLQDGGVYPMLSPRRALELFSGYYPDAMGVDELIDLLALGDASTTAWRHLSGGERQRLSLALALVGRPEIVFLDEPTAGVDPEGRIAIRGVVTELARAGACVVLATHELVEAEHLADRVVIISGGRVVADGRPGDLVMATNAGVTFGASDELEVDSLSAFVGATVKRIGPGRYRVDGSSSPETIARLTTWMADHAVALSDLSTRRTLEEAYLEILGKQER